MSDFLRSFIRHADGTWECTAHVEIQSPKGRIQVAPGTIFTRDTTFMGVDIAQWLDEQWRRRADKGRGMRG